MHLLAKLLYLYNPMIELIDVLSPAMIGTSLLATLCMTVFLQHSKELSAFPLHWHILFASAYGLCSYSICQESDLYIRICYAAFPLLFGLYHAISEGYIAYIFTSLLAVCMILAPGHMLAIWGIFIAWSILRCLSKEIGVAQLLHILLCLLFSFCLSSFRTFVYLAEHHTQSHTAYAGFSASYMPFVWISRLFTGGIPSIGLSNLNGFDLVIGMFFILMVVIYIVSHNTNRPTFQADMFCLLFSVVAITFSPVRFILTFGLPDAKTVSYSYVFVFIVLLLASKGICTISTITLKQLSIVSVIFLLAIASVYLFGSHNFVPLCLHTTLFFTVLYLILFYTYILSNHTIKPLSIVCFLIVLEFCINTLVSTNTNFIPIEAKPSDNYNIATSLFTPTTSVENLASKATPQQSELNAYRSYVFAHTNDTLQSSLAELTQISTSIDYSNAITTTYPTYFDRINALCRTLGCTEDLFTPINASLVFDDCNEYDFHSISNTTPLVMIENKHFHTNNENTPVIATFHLNLDEAFSSSKFLVAENLNGTVLLFDTDKINQTDFSLYIKGDDAPARNVMFALLSVNDSLLQTLPALIADYYSQNHLVMTYLDYLGLILSLIAIMIFIICIMKRASLNLILQEKLTAIEQSWSKCAFVNWLFANQIYILSFIIPFGIFLLSMLVTNCKPFGPNSLFDQDGLGLTLPSLMDLYFNLQDGNTYFSLYGGYGYSLYSTTPLAFLSIFYKFISANSVEIIAMLGEGLCLGLSGLFMSYYMTHRLKRVAASKHDSFLLVSATIYSLNAYMLAMHGFTSWYFLLMLVPLVMLSMDYLILSHKTALYIITLSLCMCFNIYLALYLCIFLVICFFTYSFQNITDFFKKGLRFAVCSILSAGNSFFVISGLYYATINSTYAEKDSVFPTPGLHTNYFNIIKQHMIFPLTTAVTTDEGYVCAYFSIFACIMLILFTITRKVSLLDKLRRLIPVVILYWCFNGKVMSYLWNGMHYQTKVPNRYAFLLMFMIAELCYDVFKDIKDISRRSFFISSSLLLAIFVSCSLYDIEISKLSIVTSVLLIIVYIVVFFVQDKVLFSKAIICIAILELVVNTLYTTKHYPLTDIQTLGNYTEIASDIKYNLNKTTGFARTQFPSSHIYNSGTYGTGSACLFNSFFNTYQANTNRLYGYLTAVNYMRSYHSASLFSNMFSSTTHLLYPFYSDCINLDLDQYPFIGFDDTYYIFENPNAISLGFYLPENALKNQAKQTTIPDFWNTALESFYSNERPLNLSTLTYDPDREKNNSFYYTDCDNTPLSLEEVEDSVLYVNSTTDKDNLLNKIKLHIDFVAECDGFAYIYPNEYIALKEVKKGEHVSLCINYPNPIALPSETQYLVIQNKDSLNEIYENIIQNQLENISVHDNMIEGTVDYENDGYTFYSLAYDKSWHAYIDGKEVEVEDPYHSCLAIKTPAGKHTITLKYIPYGMRLSKLISLIFIVISAISCFIYGRFQKQKNQNTTPSDLSDVEIL